MKIYIPYILAFFLSTFSLASYSHQLNIDSLSLDGTWDFKTDPNNIGEQETWYKPDLVENSWLKMSVPSNWDILNEYSHYVGRSWYRKKISIPKDWKGKTIRLNFEGIYFDSKVWVNGKLLGGSNNGFLPFEFNVSDLLNENQTNTIVVLTDNSFRLGAVWNWGGIRRPVKLIASHSLRITQQHVTPVVNLVNRTAAISVRVFIENSAHTEQTIRGEVILSKEKMNLRSLDFSATIPANSIKEVLVKTEMSREEVQLWHFDHPTLYNCNAKIKLGNDEIHQVNDRFGLRKIEVDNKGFTFKLNGETVRLVGFNLVPEDRTTGNTLPLWRVKEDVDLMKESGCNMTRLSHLPLSKEMMDYLDEKGILVFSEVTLWGADEKVFKSNPIVNEWLRQLVFNNYNHPSIIGWCVGNEIGGQNPNAMEYVEAAIPYVKSLDSSRLVVMVSHTADKKTDPIQYSDLGLINKYGENLSSVTEKIHAQHPDKLLFYSEYGIGQIGEDLAGNIDAKSLINSFRFQPYLMGASLWTFNDYRSNFYRTKGFSENRSWGVVDVFRQKKQAYFAFQKEYAPIKSLKIENLVSGKAKKSSATISITPRSILDLPAYTITGYRIVWRLKDDKGNIKKAGFELLDEIKPGDGNHQKKINWQSFDPLSLQIELVSPLNYSVYDTTVYFKKPMPPKIIYTKGVRTLINDFSKTGAIRVVVEKNSSSTTYKMRYGIEGLTEETPATSNHYIDALKLEIGQTYKVALQSINSAGEGSLSDVENIKIGYSIAPPIIRYTEPADKGFFIGYDNQEDDYLFKVQYTTKKGDYSEAKSIQSTNKGVLFVPNLRNGQLYYYRLKRIQQKFHESLWSEEISVTPDGGIAPPTPLVLGVIRKGKTAIICFDPVKKAVGYIIQYRSTNSTLWESIGINASRISQFRIDKLADNQFYIFRMASLSQYGQSAFTWEMRENDFLH